MKLQQLRRLISAMALTVMIVFGTVITAVEPASAVYVETGHDCFAVSGAVWFEGTFGVDGSGNITCFEDASAVPSSYDENSADDSVCDIQPDVGASILNAELTATSYTLCTK